MGAMGRISGSAKPNPTLCAALYGTSRLYVCLVHRANYVQIRASLFAKYLKHTHHSITEVLRGDNNAHITSRDYGRTLRQLPYSVAGNFKLRHPQRCQKYRDTVRGTPHISPLLYRHPTESRLSLGILESRAECCSLRRTPQQTP